MAFIPYNIFTRQQSLIARALDDKKYVQPLK